MTAACSRPAGHQGCFSLAKLHSMYDRDMNSVVRIIIAAIGIAPLSMLLKEHPQWVFTVSFISWATFIQSAVPYFSGGMGRNVLPLFHPVLGFSNDPREMVVLYIASFPGLFTSSFWLLSMQYGKMEGEGLGERVTCMTSGRRGGVPDNESRGPSCNILSKNLRLWRSKDSVNTARLWVTMIGHHHPPPYPHIYLTSYT